MLISSIGMEENMTGRSPVVLTSYTCWNCPDGNWASSADGITFARNRIWSASLNATGEDDEELFEYAMHPAQYEAYRSGKAKVEFKADVAKRKAEKQTAAQPATVPSQAAPASMAMAMPTTPQVMTVDVNGQSYKVTVAFGDTANAVPAETQAAPAATPAPAAAPAGTGKEVLSPLEGKFFLVKSASDTPVKVGDVVKEGDVLCYVEAMKTYNAVRAEFGGTVTAICLASGDAVSEDDVLMTIQ